MCRIFAGQDPASYESETRSLRVNGTGTIGTSMKDESVRRRLPRMITAGFQLNGWLCRSIGLKPGFTVEHNWLSPDATRKVYRVAVTRSGDGAWRVDEAETARLRG